MAISLWRRTRKMIKCSLVKKERMLELDEGVNVIVPDEQRRDQKRLDHRTSSGCVCCLGL